MTNQQLFDSLTKIRANTSTATKREVVIKIRNLLKVQWPDFDDFTLKMAMLVYAMSGAVTINQERREAIDAMIDELMSAHMDTKLHAAYEAIA